jgi:peptide chain release factor 1
LISSIMLTVLPDARAAEEADLAALRERADQVDDLDARSRAAPATARARRTRRLRWIDISFSAPIGPAFVDRTAEHVHDAAQRLSPTGT